MEELTFNASDKEDMPDSLIVVSCESSPYFWHISIISVKQKSVRDEFIFSAGDSEDTPMSLTFLPSK